MIEFYKRQIENLKKKIRAHADLGEDAEVTRLEREVKNYQQHINQNESKGVDSFLV